MYLLLYYIGNLRQNTSFDGSTFTARRTRINKIVFKHFVCRKTELTRHKKFNVFGRI